MDFPDVWDVFSGGAALRAHLLTGIIEGDLRMRPRAVRVDRWQRPLWVDHGVVALGCYEVCLKGLVLMTRKKGSNDGRTERNAGDGFPRTRWVNVGFSTDAERQCADLAATPDKCSIGFCNLAASGELDLSLKRTDSGEFMACLFGSDGGGQRLGVSAWGSSYADAIAGLLIKWHVMLDGTFDGLSLPTEKSRFR